MIIPDPIPTVFHGETSALFMVPTSKEGRDPKLKIRIKEKIKIKIQPGF